MGATSDRLPLAALGAGVGEVDRAECRVRLERDQRPPRGVDETPLPPRSLGGQGGRLPAGVGPFAVAELRRARERGEALSVLGLCGDQVWAAQLRDPLQGATRRSSPGAGRSESDPQRLNDRPVSSSADCRARCRPCMSRAPCRRPAVVPAAASQLVPGAVPAQRVAAALALDAVKAALAIHEVVPRARKDTIVPTAGADQVVTAPFAWVARHHSTRCAQVRPSGLNGRSSTRQNCSFSTISITLLTASRSTIRGFGPSRSEHFASPDGDAFDERRAYELPERLRLNHWALAGDWTIARENVVLDQAGGGIAYRFHARDAHLVLSPGAREPIPFRMLLDGEAPGRSHGVDVDEDGNGVLRDGRLYQPGAPARRGRRADPGDHVPRARR